ncbi:MAG: hypothetical protein RMJ87_04755 [Cytophagales bacterium]|nr:hypothetical protein [Bernardetiaceae bacterium]MDW8204321.1 hypothetical protein [Cytophagales bacterium]
MEEIFGYCCFIGCGIFYGTKSDDVCFGKALLIGLAANLMALTIFGCILTPIWLILLPFGIQVGVPNFGMALLRFCAVEIVVFTACYWLTRILRPVLRKAA